MSKCQKSAKRELHVVIAQIWYDKKSLLFKKMANGKAKLLLIEV